MPLDHLAKLNTEQRRAVEHGVGGEAGGLAAPLLVIAGAGSGKTNTLAHRVANLIVNGVDPRRILLMTFSRRAASEMSRRVESICAKVLGAKAGIMTDALTWAGTFHAIGARLLREYAEQIGLQPNFTIHDREDSADLMNLFRHQLGFTALAAVAWGREPLCRAADLVQRKRGAAQWVATTHLARTQREPAAGLLRRHLDALDLGSQGEGGGDHQRSFCVPDN
jgi:superfamily I DNA/RNA helicase